VNALLPAAETIAKRLIARHETIATAESSTGGLIAAALLAVPGASAYFLGGAVVYTGLAREALLGIGDAEMQGLRSATETYALHVQSIGCKHAGFPLLAGKRNGRQSLPEPEGGAFAGDGRHGSIIPSRGAARSRVCRLSLAPAVSVAAPIAGTPVATAPIAGCVVIIPGPHHWR
jgi:hypothetical protein